MLTIYLPFWVLTLIPPPFPIQGQLTAGHWCPQFFAGKSWMLVEFLLFISFKVYLGLVLCFPACPHYFWILLIWCFIQVRCLFFLLFVLQPLFHSSPALFSSPHLWLVGLPSPGTACPLILIIPLLYTEPVPLLFKMPVVIPDLYSFAVCIIYKYLILHRMTTFFHYL